jgi:hypothetical protein
LAANAVFIDCAPGATADASKAEAQRLVAAAVQAAISGDSTQSFKLFHDAIRVDPDNQLARWQLGELKIDGRWVSAEEAQRRAAVDPRQAEYRDRRKADGDTAQGQLALARWCRKSNLAEEAQFHWVNVLTIDPKNEEALRALDLRWRKGKLIARGQPAHEKDQQREAKRAAERWAAKIIKWRRSVSGTDVEARIAALDEIRAIKEAEAIPSLEDITLGRDAHDERHAPECAAIATAFLDALANMQGSAATQSLARHAVFGHSDKVRTSAIEKLKPRDQHDYVPMLMGGLGMPIETTYSLTTGPDGSVHYLRTLFREGPESDWSWESRRAAVQHDLRGRHTQYDVYTKKTTDLPSESSVVLAAKKANVASTYQNRFATNAAATEARVQQANENVETLNALIVPVLTETTGKDFGDNPKAWWDWWRSTNEYASYDHPVDRHYDEGVDKYHYSFPSYSVVNSAPPPPPRPRGPYSCFVKGTQVWTKTGLRPIESIEMGDLVLAQNVDTGELKYEPVIGRTVRPPSPIVKISNGKDEVSATRGHLFWVSGAGWRMAKELEKGGVLHGLNGATRIRSLSSAGDAEAYNLVVAEFATYFVGDSGLLVHDNTPRLPTQAVLPGIARNESRQ